MTRTRIPDLRTSAVPPAEDPAAAFRARLLDAARQSLAWHSELSHASVSGRDPDGRMLAAYAKREGPGYVSAWIREGGETEPEQHERDPGYVVLERIELARAKVVRKKREPDPRVWK
jgi:hypothetical protein